MHDLLVISCTCQVTLARLDILREQLQEQQENIPQFMPTPVSNKKEEVDVEPPQTPVDSKPQHWYVLIQILLKFP